MKEDFTLHAPHATQKMAVLQRIREFFVPVSTEPEVVTPAPPTVYEMRILNDRHLDEVWRLNQRCFKNGENYSKNTFTHLLSQPNTLSYRAITPSGKMTGFIFVSVIDGTAHLTTIGVAPEHRRRGVAKEMLIHLEQSLIEREIRMICLEVRVGNFSAQTLYRTMGYAVMQKLNAYYNNGEDGYLMIKSLI